MTSVQNIHERKTQAIYVLLDLYVQSHPRIRFGQWFCSRYISEYDSELQRIFSMPSTLAVDAVDNWLLLNHYWDLPPSLKRELKK